MPVSQDIRDKGRARRLAARRRVAAFLALVVFGFPPAAANPFDPVPLPRPRPADAPVASAAPAPAPAAAAATGPAQAIAPPVNPNSPFSAGQQRALFHINSYFNSFRTMEGDFIQFGPHGEQSEGTFYLSRPGKIRFRYSPPVKLDVIADGKNVAVRDTRTMTQDYYPLGKTPLRYLLADSIDLTSSALVSEVREEADLIAVIIVEDSRLVKGKLTLIFDPQSYHLKQWIVTDAQGLNTSVAVYNVVYGRRQDPELFKINYYALPQ